MKPLTFGSLFSGIGGLDLGLERAGMVCKWQVEIDDYATRVLTKHWPAVPKYRDVREVGRRELEPVDVVAGGFPCQDISIAGDRAGMDAERSGLWSEMHRIVCELRPRFVLVENVAAMLFPIKRAGKFVAPAPISRVLGDLAEVGYDAQWDCLSAKDVGAPHLRERVFIVAYTDTLRKLQQEGREQDEQRRIYHGDQARPESTDAREERIQRFFKGEVQRFAEFSWCKDVRRVEDLRNRPDLPEPLFRGSGDGVPHWMDRIAGLGNAVVPQVAQWIGERIVEHASLTE